MELLKNFKVVPGTLYGTPKEVWGFRTKPRRGRPARIAHDFLKANVDMLALRLRRTRTIESLGAHHIIHQQQLEGLPIYRAYVTVQIEVVLGSRALLGLIPFRRNLRNLWIYLAACQRLTMIGY